MWKKLLSVVFVCLVLSVSTVTARQLISAEANNKIAFRLLAVEGAKNITYGPSFSDGQYLIKNLLHFDNWNNSTAKYTSYIRLLSFNNLSEIFDDCKRFYAGEATSQNMEREVRNLGDSENEISILYVSSHGTYVKGPFLDEGPFLDLGFCNYVNSNQLREWLGNKIDIVIIDACCSGGWCEVLGCQRIVMASCGKYNVSRYAWRTDLPGYWGWFTGRENAQYANGTVGFEGLIGSFYAATDKNGDGWVSASEAFEFVNASTVQYSYAKFQPQNPVFYSGMADDLPLILRTEKEVKKTSDINGDGTVNIIDIDMIAKLFGSFWPHNWNEAADLNDDGIVNMLDIAMVARDFGRTT